MKPENEKSSQSKSARSAESECLYRVKGFIAKFGHLAADLIGRVGFATSRSRAEVLIQAFKTLHALGYKIRRPENLGDRHVRALVGHWEQKKLSPSTLQKRFSILRVFTLWIGKPGMLGALENYLLDPSAAHRSYVTTVDKSWSKIVDILKKIEEAFRRDVHVGAQLLAQWAFMLRALEGWQLRPLLADQGNFLAVNWGTKGGRNRVVAIREDWQRKILDFIKGYANETTGSLIPERHTLKSWKSHFYRVCRRCGISQKTGLVPHGLRHQGANDLYEKLTGAPSPVRGGSPIEVEAWLDRLARSVIAENLGHSRPEISGAYVGKKSCKRKKS